MYMPLSNLGIILVLIIYYKFISTLSSLIISDNSNHHASSLVLIKLAYQTTFSYYIIVIIEVLCKNIDLRIIEYITVPSVSFQNLTQLILQYSVHNWPQTDHTSHDG